METPRAQSRTSWINDLKFLPSAVDFYDHLDAQIDKAAHHIHLQMFIWRDDRYGKGILKKLIAAAKRGVTIRLLVDEVGSLQTPDTFFAPLKEAGGQFAWFSTLHFRKRRFFINLRNHRKLQIIDGKAAYIGGMNVGKEYAGKDKEMGEWFDLQAAIHGPAANVLQECFAEDWYFATSERFSGKEYFPDFAEVDPPKKFLAQVIASGPDSPQDPLHKSFLSLFAIAQTELWITTGYFVPNELLITGLQLCALRGVKIKLLIPTECDYAFMPYVSKAFYDQLLPYDIELYEHTGSIVHAKTLVIDDTWAMIGSANIDNRSFKLNFELNLLVHSQSINAELKKIMQGYFDDSQRVDPEAYAKRSLVKKLLEGAVRPLAPLL